MKVIPVAPMITKVIQRYVVADMYRKHVHWAVTTLLAPKLVGNVCLCILALF